jgi:hypothetical protein
MTSRVGAGKIARGGDGHSLGRPLERHAPEHELLCISEVLSKYTKLLLFVGGHVVLAFVSQVRFCSVHESKDTVPTRS